MDFFNLPPFIEQLPYVAIFVFYVIWERRSKVAEEKAREVVEAKREEERRKADEKRERQREERISNAWRETMRKLSEREDVRSEVWQATLARMAEGHKEAFDQIIESSNNRNRATNASMSQLVDTIRNLRKSMDRNTAITTILAVNVLNGDPESKKKLIKMITKTDG